MCAGAMIDKKGRDHSICAEYSELLCPSCNPWSLRNTTTVLLNNGEFSTVSLRKSKYTLSATSALIIDQGLWSPAVRH
eukprot:m.930257 g.930257  ORF g.930257 m.930257 type:complete len:78 (+) comp23782_c0_seq41:1908-2141(+)